MISSGLQTGGYTNKKKHYIRKRNVELAKREKKETLKILKLENESTVTPLLILFVKRQFTRNKAHSFVDFRGEL